VKIPFGHANDSIGLPIWAMGTSEPVRVLLIDDDNDEAALTRSLLARVHDVRYELDWVSTFSEGLASIGRNQHHAYLIDQQLGGMSGTDLVREAREAGSLAALIMMTGQGHRATDVAAMKAGATDFLTKGQVDIARLDRTLRYAITHAAAISAIEASSNRVSGLEELGHILVENGPSPATMARVVDLIVERFGFARVAIYLADGDVMELAGQRGHERPVRSLSRFDAGVERVERGRKPMFVPSLSSERDLEGADTTVATELSVPLMVAGEAAGLLNIASPVATPIGEEDFAAIRLVADRLTAALAIVHERIVAEAQLRRARRDLEEPQVFVDGVTSAYRRPLLEPLLDVAIAGTGGEGGYSPGLMLLACAEGAGTIRRLDIEAKAVFGDRPRVRIGKTKLAIVMIATSETDARSAAYELMTVAQKGGFEVWCGYTPWTVGWTSTDLVAAAHVALAYAQREPAGTVIS
jgi:FixJ family two-component response regulator